MSIPRTPSKPNALFFAFAVLLASCGNVESTPPNTTVDSAATSNSERAETEQTKPWWEGRTWAGEIDVCVSATDDVSGCQWLAGLLIHRRCELKMYQTFAAALYVGVSVEALYRDAVVQGECEEVRKAPPAEVSSVLHLSGMR